MTYYMDRHDLPGATPADVALAHQQDLAVQERFGVRFLSYWFDYDRHTAFCLVDAPSEDAARAVHAASHGFMPSEIIAVDRSMVEMFLGRVVDPAVTGSADSAFRVIMFTDMQGSTELTQRLGDDAAMAVLRRHDSIVRSTLQANHGTEVKHTGDGIMASFVQVSDALGCAIAIQREIATHNAAAEPDAQFQVRIGVTAGEPVTERDDLFGATVQLAARLCSAAAPGEICVAETVSGLALGKRFEFTPTRELTLKGFTGTVRAVGLRWADELRAEEGTPSAVGSQRTIE